MGGPGTVRKWLACHVGEQTYHPNLIHPSPPESESGVPPIDPDTLSPEETVNPYVAWVRRESAASFEVLGETEYNYNPSYAHEMMDGIDQAYFSHEQYGDGIQYAESSGGPSNLTELIYGAPGDISIDDILTQEEFTQDDDCEQQYSASIYAGSQGDVEDYYNGPRPSLLFRADNVPQTLLSGVEKVSSGQPAKDPEQDAENEDLLILPVKARLEYPTRPATPELASRGRPDPKRIVTFPNGVTYTGFQIDRFVLAQFLRENDLDDAFNQVCKWIDHERCARNNGTGEQCKEMVHFQRRFNAVTDIKLGDCSYLGSCYNKDTCPYVHYDMIPAKKPLTMAEKAFMGNIPEASRELLKTVGEGDELRGMKRCKAGVWIGCISPLQWINIDVTVLPMDVLGGDYGAIMMDPPWPIHMRLPYRQMSDEDILNLEIEKLSKNGVIFLWVTSRVYSIGVKCLEKWGYKHTDSILWVKTNQLGGTIATGRTGHWLNHMQETCLVGIKGKPTLLAGNAGNVLVEKVRETSRKPEGIYEIIEALVGPYCPKVEIFGRQHNIRHGWLTIGNQLPSTYVHDIGIYNRLLEFTRKCRVRKIRLNPPIFFQPSEPDRDEYARQYYIQRQMEALMPTDLEECRKVANEAFAEADGDTVNVSTLTKKQKKSMEKAKEALAKFLAESRIFFPPEEWKTQTPPSIPQLEMDEGSSSRPGSRSHIPALLAPVQPVIQPSVQSAVNPTGVPPAAPPQTPPTDNTSTNNRAKRRQANREKKKAEKKKVVSKQSPTRVPDSTSIDEPKMSSPNHNIPDSQTTPENGQGAAAFNPQANTYLPPGSNGNQPGFQLQQPRARNNGVNARQPMQVHQWTPAGEAIGPGAPLAARANIPRTYTTPSGLEITRYPRTSQGAQRNNFLQPIVSYPLYPINAPRHIPGPSYPPYPGGFNPTGTAQAQVPPQWPNWTPPSTAAPYHYTHQSQMNGYFNHPGSAGFPQYGGPPGPPGQFATNGNGHYGYNGNQGHHGPRENHRVNGMHRSETQNHNHNNNHYHHNHYVHSHQAHNSGMNRSQTIASMPGNHQGNNHGNHQENQRGGYARGRFQGRHHQRPPPLGLSLSGLSLSEETGRHQPHQPHQPHRPHQPHQPGYTNGHHAASPNQQDQESQDVQPDQPRTNGGH